MQLSERDRQMLEGHHGEAARFAMSVIVRTAEAVGAEELLSIEQAHIDACALKSPSSLDLVRHLVDNGGHVSIPTTLSMISLDLEHWQELGIPEDVAAPSLEIADSYRKLGCIPTWSCAPYQGYLAPRFGQQIAWGESNAVAYANSVLGARTNRYADYLDICTAITGRAPYTGLHCTENRKASLHIRVEGTTAVQWKTTAAWAALGSLVGTLSGEHVPVIEGFPEMRPTNDMLKAFGAAAASSGAVGLAHFVGVTPEATTLEAACQGDIPSVALPIGPRQLREAWEELSTMDDGNQVDAVVLGCPHFSYGEFEALATAIDRQQRSRVHENVQLLIFCSRADYDLARRGGLVDPLRVFGATFVRDTCPFYAPVIAASARAIATNSGKCAYYAPGELGTRVHFTSLDGCVAAAATGAIQGSRLPW